MTAKPFWDRVDASGDCWEWTGALAHGYGSYSIWKVGTFIAHRYAYKQLVGPIPAGLQLDHLCRNTRCVNPDHLEPVTPRVNTLRSPRAAFRKSRRTHCPQGHPYDEANTYHYPATATRNARRGCRTCMADQTRAHWARKRAAAA